MQTTNGETDGVTSLVILQGRKPEIFSNRLFEAPKGKPRVIRQDSEPFDGMGPDSDFFY